MKNKYLSIVILLILASTLIAQNHEPIPLYFNYDGPPARQLSLNQSRFQQDKIITGWQWGSGTHELNKIMNINGTFSYFPDSELEMKCISWPVFMRNPTGINWETTGYIGGY